MPDSFYVVYPWIHVVARVLFSLFCIVFGSRHLFGAEVPAYLQSKGVPGPKPVSVVTGLMLLVGGVFVLLGWHRFIGAGLVFLVLFPAGWAVHPFWTVDDPTKRQDEMAHFFKVLALAGASLFIAFYGGSEWPLSLGG